MNARAGYVHEQNLSLAVNEIVHARELINNAAQIDLSWDFLSSFFLFVSVYFPRSVAVKVLLS